MTDAVVSHVKAAWPFRSYKTVSSCPVQCGEILAFQIYIWPPIMSFSLDSGKKYTLEVQTIYNTVVNHTLHFFSVIYMQN